MLRFIMFGLFGLFGLLLVGCSVPKNVEVVELPRPNSGTYSYEQAGARKHEVLQAAQTEMMTDWSNPLRSFGFSIHIEQDGQLTIYNGSPFASSPWEVDEGAEFVYRTEVIGIDELPALLDRYHGIQWGNPLGVLVTTSVKPNESDVFDQVVELLYQPSIQLYYAKQK